MSISFISIDIARISKCLILTYFLHKYNFVSSFIKNRNFKSLLSIPSYQIFSVHLKINIFLLLWSESQIPSREWTEHFKNKKTKDILARSMVLYLIQFHGVIFLQWSRPVQARTHTCGRRDDDAFCAESGRTQKKASSRVGALFHGRAKIFIVWKWTFVGRLVRVYIRRVSTLFLECPGTHGSERVKVLHYNAGRGFRSRREEVGSRNRAGNSISCYLNDVMGRATLPPSSIRAVRAAKSITMIIRRDSSRISSDSPPHPWTFLIIKSSGESLIFGRLDGVW